MKRIVVLIVSLFFAGFSFCQINNLSGGGTVTTEGDSSWVSISVDSSIQFTPQTSVEYSEGLIYYDADDNTLVVYNDEADVSLNVGEEMYKRVRNNSGSLITDGTPAYISGAVGQLSTIAETDADASATSLFVGLATHDIENNSNGYITTYGIVRGLDTDGSPYSESWSDGDQIYISTTAGELTNVRPSSAFVVCIGHVDYAHTSSGRLQVHPKTDWAIDYRLEDSLNYANGASIDNSETDTLTLTETVIKIEGQLIHTGLMLGQHAGAQTNVSTSGTQTIGTGGTFERLNEGAIAYTASHLDNFTHDDGRLTYTGAPDLHFLIIVNVTIESDEATALVQIRLAKGGATILLTNQQHDFRATDTDASFGFSWTEEMSTNEYLEVFGTSDTNGDTFLVHNIAFTITQQ